MDRDNPFELDQRLQQDTLWVADLPLCRVLLMNDRRYPWLILVPRRNGLTEVTDLNGEDQALLCQESLQVCCLLQQLHPEGKLNLGALGNVVAQLHLHHVMRYAQDPAWPGPVWGHSPAEPYPDPDAQELLQRLRSLL